MALNGSVIGAAAIALGLSLAGPQTIGVAWAEVGEADPATPSAGPADVRGGAARAARAPERTPRAGTPTVGVRDGSTVPRAAAAGTGSPSLASRSVARRAAADAVDSRAFTPPAAARRAVAPPSAAAKAVLPVDDSDGLVANEAALTTDPTTNPPGVADTPELTYAGVQASAVPVADRSRRLGVAPVLEQSMARANTAVLGFFDAVSRLLSALPPNPLSDVLSGALLLIRRGLFNQAPTVYPRVLVGEMLVPMWREEGLAFSTTLVGEVTGSLGAVDPEGAPLSYELMWVPEYGDVEISADGTWTYTPDDLAAGAPDAFTVAVKDGGWNLLAPFAPPTEVTIHVQPGLGSSNKPGLIASDYLRVLTDTGEWGWAAGDEPVLLTVAMTTTLGVAGSTTVWVVDSYPNEISSGVKGGAPAVRIPDEDGDIWLHYSDKFKPLTQGAWEYALTQGSVVEVAVTSEGAGYSATAPTVQFVGGLDPNDANAKAATGRVILKEYVDDPYYDPTYRVASIEITDAGRGYIDAPEVVIEGPGGLGWTATAEATLGSPAPIPVVVIATLVLEGDGSPSALIGALGFNIAQKFERVGKELEDTKVLISPVLGGDFTAISSAAEKIKAKAALSAYDKAELVAMRVGQWYGSGYDPDDPLAIGVTALIPVEGEFLENFPIELKDAKFGDFQLTNYMYEARSDVSVVNAWTFDLVQRFGFLVPAKYNTSVVNPDTKATEWTTVYTGDYLDNDDAAWEVDTGAWDRIFW